LRDVFYGRIFGRARRAGTTVHRTAVWETSGKTDCSAQPEEKIDTSSAAGELAVAAARTKGKRPGWQPLGMTRIEAAIKLVEAKLSPAEAAEQLGLSRSTIYREMRRLAISRSACTKSHFLLPWRCLAYFQRDALTRATSTTVISLIT
jgi:transcriptional regulator with GAF, ATPase, and Fis domain